jgi:hypothetical protein
MLKRMSLAALLVAMAVPALAADASYRDVAPAVKTSSTAVASQTAPAPKMDCACQHHS